MKIDKRRGSHARPMRKEKLVRRKFYMQDQRRVVFDYKRKSLLNKNGFFFGKKRGGFSGLKKERAD